MLRVRASAQGLGLLLGVGASAQRLGHCLGLALRIRLELRSGYVRVSAVLGQGKQFQLLKTVARIDT